MTFWPNSRTVHSTIPGSIFGAVENRAGIEALAERLAADTELER